MFTPLPPNIVLQNRYRIVSRLDNPDADGKGKGGFGAVYLAEAAHLGCEVAIKQMYLGDNAELDNAFRREAKLLANLRHHSLPRVTDYFTEGNVQFLVMELVRGKDLDDVRVQQGGRLPFDLALKLTIELLDALDYLHTQTPPIIHRDIKPANLKLTTRGQLMLLDFGIAKGTAGLMTEYSRSIQALTPGYAPPEQQQAEGTTPQSDLYSTAATFYSLLTGNLPPSPSIRVAHIAAGKLDPLQSVDKLNPDVPPKVARVFQDALALLPEKRPASAAAMRRKLLEAMQDKRITAEESKTERIRPTSVEDEQSPLILEKPEAERVLPKAFTNLIGMEFVLIPRGEFKMGRELNRSHFGGDYYPYPEEKPIHKVKISRDFYIAKYQVTQEEWVKVMGSNPSYFKSDNRLPVENVSWTDAKEFVSKLNARKDGYLYRLPTEAEWEYACRAGRDFYAGNLKSMAWYFENSVSSYIRSTHIVGTKHPNAFGLYDMCGNVWEWCEDWYDLEYYAESPRTDPTGPEFGSYRVARGGGWNTYTEDTVNPAARASRHPELHASDLGFRVVGIAI
ncbi:MAG: bifunctional serine/threonine-protein kinase/formylglycine-generating enzyme family protein [Acidobacteriota bacterium]|nr:bifunctional serine/threonine-protein kinase/formylglycine-generating enzyme family protein [Acidobacteriota bacterium]